MNRFAYTLVTTLGAASAATQAEVPIFKDNVLMLQETLVIRDAATPGYYKNVQLRADAQGNFAIVKADSRQLTQITRVDFIMLPGLPVVMSLDVSGTMSTSCLGLETPLVARTGKVFTVAVAETPYDPAIQCFSGITMFTINIPLDLKGLEAGEYRVLVNGVERRFILSHDN